MPSRADIDVLELRPWLGNLMLLDVLADAFRYRVYGSSLAALYGRDLTGRTVSRLPPDVQPVVAEEYAVVVRTRRPSLVEQFRNIGNGTIRLTKLILPLSSGGGSVDMLLAGIYPIEDKRAHNE